MDTDVDLEMNVEEDGDGEGGFGESISVAAGPRRRGGGGYTSREGVGAIGIAQVNSHASVGSLASTASTSSLPLPFHGEVKVKVEQSGDRESDIVRGGEHDAQGIEEETAVKENKEKDGGERKAEKKAIEVRINPGVYAEEARTRGRAKGRSEEEVECMSRIAYRFASALATDHNSVLDPDIESPFEDARDAVHRLLPYHVFLQPREDLEMLLERPLSELRGHGAYRRKGKRKATEEELVREEIRETMFALDCWRRKTHLEKRFRKARVAEGKRVAPDTQAYILARDALETEKQQLAMLQAEYKASKAELDRVEKEKKERKAAAQAQSQSNSSTGASTTKFASQASGSGPGKTQSTAPATPLTAAIGRPTYNYAYQPSYQAYSYAPSTPSSSTPALPSTSQTPQPSTSQPTNPSTSTSTMSETSPILSLPSQPIPVLLPVSSLTSLASLGIVPMHPSHAAEQTEPVPAILRGTTQTQGGGTMVSLEINVAALGGAQASGLALLLSALTSRGVVGTNSGSGNVTAT
ncbi:hypothetical protein BDY19DRAFT_989740 [Irpex rosettiformis]|uniref:Uncharacterized protein n=1 Tax=Irpex rosettiformis TaxID=378272 RepID=A0ACB8UFD5_9APHY|nr:hypothetical protein BDY19DRAFT_989740 [Irpex rosettiformis]